VSWGGGGGKPPFFAGPPPPPHGRGFGRDTRVLVDGDPLPADSVSPARIEAKLPAALRAGLHALQVQAVRSMGTPPAKRPGSGSNVVAFMLRPRIRKAGGGHEVAVANAESHGDGTHSADVAVRVEPEVGRGQRAALVLNERSAAGEPESYTFVAAPRDDDGGEIRFRVSGVKPAEYLVRVQVDGAESPLELAGGKLSGPRVTL
jgi:hypothetical protein